MLYGVIVADGTVMLTDRQHGKQLVSLEEPPCPAGFHTEQRIDEDGQCVVISYDIVPDEGSREQAALALCQTLFQQLPDATAYQLRALAPIYECGVTYETGVRFKDQGNLWRATETFTAPHGVHPEDPSVPCELVQPDAQTGQAEGTE